MTSKADSNHRAPDEKEQTRSKKNSTSSLKLQRYGAIGVLWLVLVSLLLLMRLANGNISENKPFNVSANFYEINDDVTGTGENEVRISYKELGIAKFKGGYLKLIGCYFGLVEEDSPYSLSEPCILWMFVIAMLCAVHNSLLYGEYHHEFEWTQKPENRRTIEDIIPALK